MSSVWNWSSDNYFSSGQTQWDKQVETEIGVTQHIGQHKYMDGHQMW